MSQTQTVTSTKKRASRTPKQNIVPTGGNNPERTQETGASASVPTGGENPPENTQGRDHTTTVPIDGEEDEIFFEHEGQYLTGDEYEAAILGAVGNKPQQNVDEDDEDQRQENDVNQPQDQAASEEERAKEVGIKLALLQSQYPEFDIPLIPKRKRDEQEQPEQDNSSKKQKKTPKSLQEIGAELSKKFLGQINIKPDGEIIDRKPFLPDASNTSQISNSEAGFVAFVKDKATHLPYNLALYITYAERGDTRRTNPNFDKDELDAVLEKMQEKDSKLSDNLIYHYNETCNNVIKVLEKFGYGIFTCTNVLYSVKAVAIRKMTKLSTDMAYNIFKDVEDAPSKEYDEDMKAYVQAEFAKIQEKRARS
ncbi:hypothetical protein HDU89_006958 [Geranomyces variabilis]|nr:hypothetical protein HDU89_006958 [Geranomyces variabilis]